jgi:hypothetical protein
MIVLMVCIALTLAFWVGYATRRGSICAVYATRSRGHCYPAALGFA